MHSNKLGGTSCGLLYMSLSLNPRAARLGIIEQCNTCLIVFLHNTTDPAGMRACVLVSVPMCCHFMSQKVMWIPTEKDLYGYKGVAICLSPHMSQDQPTMSVKCLFSRVWLTRPTLFVHNFWAHLQITHAYMLICWYVETNALTPVAEYL